MQQTQRVYLCKINSILCTYVARKVLFKTGAPTLDGGQLMLQRLPGGGMLKLIFSFVLTTFALQYMYAVRE